ncbi:MAG: hypothetical protein C5B53_09735 [Candidatus Melainabacteria bacterium]|nr:MAG: hypothetical protein C5B53_09735 [Candidatus Melainabacteria bacterium]
MALSKLANRKQGFTILELFIITLIVAILAFVGWRSYKLSKDIERESIVRRNMHVAEVAAKAYSKDSGGTFPPSNDDPAYLSYFPGGSCDQEGKRAGNFPINPFTNRPEAPQAGHINDVNQVRQHAPIQIGSAGQIFYSPISAGDSQQVTSFAVQGADHAGLAIGGSQPNTSLVLSNH